jgi:very-short-patch-repair endonuclease
MSLNRKWKLVNIAQIVCRDLRKRQTNAEQIFWEAVRNRKFYNLKFVRQFPFFHDITGKETFFVADFFCFEKKIIVELDGRIHRYRLREDEDRTKILNKLGLKVIRICNDEVENDMKGVMEKLRKLIS